MSDFEELSTDISPPHFEDSKLKKKAYYKKKKNRCPYQDISANLKYVYPTELHQICGDIFLAQYNESLVSDISFLNEFKICSLVNVKELFNQKVVSVELVDRKDVLKESMDNLLTYLETSDNPSLLKWKNTIKSYSSIYSKVIIKQSRKKPKGELRKKFYARVMEGTASQTEALFTNFPCIQSKYRVRNHKAHLTEIIISESFINELGYNIEKFIEVVLSEGFPRIMNYCNPDNSFCLRTMIENYFKIEEQGLSFPGLEGQLIMKDQYVKDVIYQYQMLMNYESRTFGFDVILTLSHKGEPYIEEGNLQVKKLNPNFIQAMSDLEEERNKFLSDFYSLEPRLDWFNYDKTCSFKELNMFNQLNEDTYIKKKEEE